MSAGYLVDLFDTTQIGVSITSTPFLSGGLIAVASGAVVGQSIDMLNANSFCNLLVQGVSQSGQLRVGVQTADSDTSGLYTDPTSGLAQLPTAFSSGGILWINSGGAGGGTIGAFVSGQAIASGFSVGAGFQRPGRYVRAFTLNEGAVQYGGPLVISFVSQLKTTGSGGGFSYSPGSGTPFV